MQTPNRKLLTFIDDSAAESIEQKVRDSHDFSIKDSQAVETLIPIGDKSGDEVDEKTALKNRMFEQGIIVESEKMLSLYQDVQAVAGINVPVLILGEPGTGEEHVARALHNFSKSRGDFIPLSLATEKDFINLAVSHPSVTTHDNDI